MRRPPVISARGAARAFVDSSRRRIAHARMLVCESFATLTRPLIRIASSKTASVVLVW